MSFFPKWILFSLCILIAGFAGLMVGAVSDTPERVYIRAKSTLRETLGLEKDWRSLPGPDQATGRDAIPCPAPSETVVIVTGGQSNAANLVPAPYTPAGDVSVWFDGRCFHAADPQLGAMGRNGSIWSLLGDRLAEKLDRPVLLINGAVNGTQFGDWLDTRSQYYATLSQRVEAAGAAGYRPDVVLWHQGETDAAAERDMEALERDISRLMDRLLDDMPEAKVYLFQATRCIGAYRQNGVPEVVEVQQKVAAERPRVIAGMNTDTLGRDTRWDMCHFNSLGREMIVAQAAPEIAAMLRNMHRH